MNKLCVLIFVAVGGILAAVGCAADPIGETSETSSNALSDTTDETKCSIRIGPSLVVIGTKTDTREACEKHCKEGVKPPTEGKVWAYQDGCCACYTFTPIETDAAAPAN